MIVQQQLSAAAVLRALRMDYAQSCGSFANWAELQRGC